MNKDFLLKYDIESITRGDDDIEMIKFNQKYNIPPTKEYEINFINGNRIKLICIETNFYEEFEKYYFPININYQRRKKIEKIKKKINNY